MSAIPPKQHRYPDLPIGIFVAVSNLIAPKGVPVWRFRAIRAGFMAGDFFGRSI